MWKSLVNFVSYWYFRYSLVSEMYVIEKWEEILVYVIFGTIFFILSMFNNHIVLAFVAAIVKWINSISTDSYESLEL